MTLKSRFRDLLRLVDKHTIIDVCLALGIHVGFTAPCRPLNEHHAKERDEHEARKPLGYPQQKSFQHVSPLCTSSISPPWAISFNRSVSIGTMRSTWGCSCP